jgi:hypothetical protein
MSLTSLSYAGAPQARPTRSTLAPEASDVWRAVGRLAQLLHSERVRRAAGSNKSMGADAFRQGRSAYPIILTSP